MVAISGWKAEEEALCCDGGARKVLEGSGRVEEGGGRALLCL